MFWKGFWLFGMPWSIAHQNPLSMGFLRQEYWSGLPFPSPGNLTDSRIEPRSLPLKADSLPSESPAKPIKVKWALRLENSSNRFSFSMKWNTREFSLLSLCLCVLFSVFPTPHPVCMLSKYWVGQRVPLGFSIQCYGQIWNELFGQPGISTVHAVGQRRAWQVFWIHCLKRLKKLVRGSVSLRRGYSWKESVARPEISIFSLLFASLFVLKTLRNSKAHISHRTRSLLVKVTRSCREEQTKPQISIKKNKN